MAETSTVHLASRIMTVALLLLGTFLCGILPIYVRRNLMSCNCNGPTCKKSCRARRGKVITTFLIYLGGGVLLATCLIHLLPEAREGFEKYQEAQKKLLTINKTDDLKSTAQDADLFNHPSVVLNKTGDDDDDGGDHEHFPIPEFTVCCGFFAVYLLEEVLHFFLGGHTHVPTESRAIRSLSRSNSCASPCPGDPAPPSDHHEKQAQDQNNFVISEDAHCRQRTKSHSFPIGFSVSGLLTVAALSFHSLFEGFAIGLQKTDKGIWILFGAIAVHKFVISFVVGLEVLATGGRDLLVVIYMAVFASMSPLGMIAAMITDENIDDLDNAPIIEGVLNAIATGTLLYVTFCEILQRDEEEKESLPGWMQFLATFLGFGIMCIVQYGSTFA